ncbi:pyridoxamine 5'-phosphate oxidase family protein [Mycobacterium sp.]|uniref:pyridoxamine 5'-phosphate oxidase family protein n=1 Tax=Mycobacterium sp. TaxID=1785 RepID=UPI003D0CE3C0
MSFTDEEVAYLNSQPLGRIATVAPDGQPDVSGRPGVLHDKVIRWPKSPPRASFTLRRACWNCHPPSLG